MIAEIGSERGQPLWIVKRAPWLLIGTMAPIAFVPTYATLGLSGRKADPRMIIPLVAALVTLQLWHSFAAAAGKRPAGWHWTFAALVVLVYLPIVHYSWNYALTQSLVVASAGMLLRGPLAPIVITLPVVGTGIWAWYTVTVIDHEGPATATIYVVYWLTLLAGLGGALYGTARLVHVIRELYATRTELAEVAIGRERVRVSRDLHDLLGQSLSAVSLKGDLAIRLLPSEADQAGVEIESLVGLARDARRDVQEIALDEHSVSLHRELDAAAALLGAAGIAAWVDTDTPDVSGDAHDVLAWAVREGTTNLLRHSESRNCWITLSLGDGILQLVIVNDGLRHSKSGPGSGLNGLRERAKAVSGSVKAGPDRDGRFRLVVAVPVVEA